MGRIRGNSVVRVRRYSGADHVSSIPTVRADGSGAAVSRALPNVSMRRARSKNNGVYGDKTVKITCSTVSGRRIVEQHFAQSYRQMDGGEKN